MSANQGYASYTTNSARYASPGMQVAMLLAAAARHMETARDCMDKGEIEGRFNATEKCAVIISGLRGCLSRDTAEAAAMATTLDTYYGRMLAFLTQINVKNDRNLCEAVIESLRTMSSTWREVQARADAEARASITTPPTGSGSGGGQVSA
jgi:flagellar protein FliS